MDPKRTYDYLELARQRVLDSVRRLDDEQYRRTFPIGPGSLARTLTHVMISEWYYMQRLRGRHIPPYAEWPIREESPLPFATLETHWQQQASDTREALTSVRDWSEEIEYGDTDDAGNPVTVVTSPADLFTQLALHEVHHRAQVLNMLRQLGVTFSSDLDFNALMYTRREVIA